MLCTQIVPGFNVVADQFMLNGGDLSSLVAKKRPIPRTLLAKNVDTDPETKKKSNKFWLQAEAAFTNLFHVISEEDISNPSTLSFLTTKQNQKFSPVTTCCCQSLKFPGGASSDRLQHYSILS